MKAVMRSWRIWFSWVSPQEERWMVLGFSFGPHPVKHAINTNAITLRIQGFTVDDLRIELNKGFVIKPILLASNSLYLISVSAFWLLRFEREGSGMSYCAALEQMEG